MLKYLYKEQLGVIEYKTLQLEYKFKLSIAFGCTIKSFNGN